jgi:hypothetical protein
MFSMDEGILLSYSTETQTTRFSADFQNCNYKKKLPIECKAKKNSFCIYNGAAGFLEISLNFLVA